MDFLYIGNFEQMITTENVSTSLDRLIVSEYKKNNVSIPRNKSYYKSSEGGFILDPKYGITKDKIVCLDFVSYHPSIIYTFNISPETKVGTIIQVYEDFVKLDTGKIIKKCNLKNYIITPSKTLFSKDKKGVIPLLIESLLKLRKDNKSNSQLEKDYKLLANTVYGNFGYCKSPIYDIDCSKAIISVARNIICKCIGMYEEDVVYAYTDSMFIKDYCDELDELNSFIDNYVKEKFNVNDSIIKLNRAQELDFICILTKQEYFAHNSNEDWIFKGSSFNSSEYSEKTRSIVKDIVVKTYYNDVNLNDVLKEKFEEYKKLSLNDICILKIPVSVEYKEAIKKHDEVVGCETFNGNVDSLTESDLRKFKFVYTTSGLIAFDEWTKELNLFFEIDYKENFKHFVCATVKTIIKRIKQ